MQFKSQIIYHQIEVRMNYKNQKKKKIDGGNKEENNWQSQSSPRLDSQ